MMLRILRRALSAGVLAILAACGGGGDGGGGASAPAPAASEPVANRAPRAGILANGDVRVSPTGISATLTGLLRFDGSASTDADNDPLSYEWTLVTRPAGSTAAFASTNQPLLEWRPDAMGAYVFQLRVTDGRGGNDALQVPVTVDNRPPVSSLVITPTFNPVVTNVPTQAVTVGANLLLDATSTTDPDGDVVTVSFDLSERPAGSTAALVLAGRTARLVPDALGTFRVRVRGLDPRGASFESVYTFNANNRAPSPVVVTSATSGVANAGQATLQTSVGYDVVLNGTTSADPDGDPITREWALTSRPVGSAAVLSSTAATVSGFSPDVLGSYVVTLTATDPRGARSAYTTTIQVNNRRPVAHIGSNATPGALPSVPDIRVPVGTEVTLRGSNSVDADGDVLTYAWSVVSRPVGSTASLSSATAADTRLVVDREGTFTLWLRVTDPAGAFSERTVTLNVGSHAPVAVLDRARITLVLGEQLRVRASSSFDEDGDPLTFQWSLDARPSGSTSTIANETTPSLSFTPDMPGTYVAAVTVSDGRSSSSAYVAVKVLSQITTSVGLDFLPEEARYSMGLDKLVMTSGNTLRVLDPHTSALHAVTLPLNARRLHLSGNGRLAVVLHTGAFSLVDLETATLIRNTPLQTVPTEAFVSDSGTVWLLGDGITSVAVFNGRTGDRITQAGPTGRLHGGAGPGIGLFAERVNKGFLMSQGVSPVDISYFDVTPATSQVTRLGDSPYHGSYAMSSPFFLSESQDLLFSSSGNYFRTDNLTLAGTLAGSGSFRSLSHSAVDDEALVLALAGTAYKRYTGALFVPGADAPLPLLNGQQTYGLNIFHSAGGHHVLVVQTVTSVAYGTGAQYHVIVR